MMRPFEQTDLRRIEVNEYSLSDINVDFIFNDADFYKQTLECDKTGRIMAILCFKAYWEQNYICFLLMSKHMGACHARTIKKFVHGVMADFGCNRLQTDSLDCPVINRWHEFLGFQLEGTRRKIIDDKDFNMWAILRGKYADCRGL
jgi:hypothetical protein